jgi:hypothetical protein
MTYIDQVLNYGFAGSKPSSYVIAINLLVTLSIATTYFINIKISTLISIAILMTLIMILYKKGVKNYSATSIANFMLLAALIVVLWL